MYNNTRPRDDKKTHTLIINETREAHTQRTDAFVLIHIAVELYFYGNVIYKDSDLLILYYT